VAATRFKAPIKGRTNVSRQSPNSRGRKRTPQGPRGVQAGDRREVRHAILYHKLGRKNCPSVSLRGVGADRAKAGGALHLQSYEEKVPGPVNYWGQQVEMDGQGRLLMPQLLRDSAQI